MNKDLAYDNNILIKKQILIKKGKGRGKVNKATKGLKMQINLWITI